MSGVWAYLSAAISGHIRALNEIRVSLRAVITGLFESLRGQDPDLPRSHSAAAAVAHHYSFHRGRAHTCFCH